MARAPRALLGPIRQNTDKRHSWRVRPARLGCSLQKVVPQSAKHAWLDASFTLQQNVKHVMVASTNLQTSRHMPTVPIAALDCTTPIKATHAFRTNMWSATLALTV